MKKLIALLIPLIFALSCEQYDDAENFLTTDQILGNNEYTVYNGILTFRNKEAFKKLNEELASKTTGQLIEWESQNNFKSLRSLHEEAIQREEVYLQDMAAKYPNNTTLTRKELGYTKFSQDFIDKGLFVVNEFETLDMNVTAPHFGSIVNVDGVFRMGDNIIMPQLKTVKILKNGDASKLTMLKNASTSDETRGIQVNEITRNTFKKSESETARTNSETWTSCSNVNDGYKLVVYEEIYNGNVYPDEIPCYGGETSYWLGFRSLKKILGTWQNHKTSQWYVVSTVKIEHQKTCYYSNNNCNQSTISSYYSTPVDYTNHQTNIPYGHSQNVYFLTDYERGPCGSGGFASCPAQGPFCDEPVDPYAVLIYLARSHYVYGKGGTSCYVGE